MKEVQASQELIKLMEIKDKLTKINNILINMEDSMLPSLEEYSESMNQTKLKECAKNLRLTFVLRSLNGQAQYLLNEFIDELQEETTQIDEPSQPDDNMETYIEMLGNIDIY